MKGRNQTTQFRSARNATASCRQRSLGTISSSRCQTTRETQFHPWTGGNRVSRIHCSRTSVGSSKLACRAVARGNRPAFACRLRRGSLRLAPRAKAGGARRNRTDDLLLAKQALSQLSYGPWSAIAVSARRAEARGPARLRPFGLRRGSLLSSSASEGWWAWEDLNFRPHAYQARALTN